VKNRLYIWFAVSLLFAIHALGDPADLTNAVYLAPPTNFHAYLITHQPTGSGDNFLSLDGQEFLSYVKYGGDGGQIIFCQRTVKTSQGGSNENQPL
jgi:hypothetical protein